LGDGKSQTEIVRYKNRRNNFKIKKLMLSRIVLPCILFGSGLIVAQDNTESDRTTRRDPQPQIRYPLGPDSLPREGVPKGKLEGPFLFHSKVIENTVRKYWVYVPPQYKETEPACVLVFQDGARAINPKGVLRAPQVLENLIAKKQIPVTIGIFITPGQRGNEFPAGIGTGNPRQSELEYDGGQKTHSGRE
jgi:enterochelin esterase-like enzyme